MCLASRKTEGESEPLQKSNDANLAPNDDRVSNERRAQVERMMHLGLQCILKTDLRTTSKMIAVLAYRRYQRRKRSAIVGEFPAVALEYAQSFVAEALLIEQPLKCPHCVA